jgi:hypothetical protein
MGVASQPSSRRILMVPDALTKENLRKYQALRRRYTEDVTYRIVVDMYRNLHGECSVAAHFMGAYDLKKYTVKHRETEQFAPIRAGYLPEELDFLAGRGLKPF